MTCSAIKRIPSLTCPSRRRFNRRADVLIYYPVYLDLRKRPVLLVGAGAVAWQKIPALLASEARVHVVSPEAKPEFRRLARGGKIRWSRRPYRASDLKGARLVIAATDDVKLQKRISQEARARGIWSNVVDVPPLCDFIAPAIVKRGDIQIAISTGGAAPALAKFLRRKLEHVMGPEHEGFVNMVKTLRPRILKLEKPKRLALWECIASEGFLEEIRRHGLPRARKRLLTWIKQAK